jgi:hypothetical protein
MHADWFISTHRDDGGLWFAEVEEVVAGDHGTAVVEAVHRTELFGTEAKARRAAEDWLRRYQLALESRWSPC